MKLTIIQKTFIISNIFYIMKKVINHMTYFHIFLFRILLIKKKPSKTFLELKEIYRRNH